MTGADASTFLVSDRRLQQSDLAQSLVPPHLPPELQAQILQRVYASTEGARALFRLERQISKSIAADLQSHKALVRMLHVTIDAGRPNVLNGLDRFVRSFPSVGQLKVTFVHTEPGQNIDARCFVSWLVHWRESLRQLSLDVQGPEIEIDGWDSSAQYESQLPFLQLDPFSLRYRSDDHSITYDELREAVSQSRIEFVSLRHSEKMSIREPFRVPFRGPSVRRIRLEGLLLSGFYIFDVGLSFEELELVTHTKDRTAFPVSSFLTHYGTKPHNLKTPEVVIPELRFFTNLRKPLLQFSYTDTSPEAHSPLWLELRHLSKLRTLRVLTRNPTSIFTFPANGSHAVSGEPGTSGSLDPIEQQETWDLRHLVIDTGLQSSLVGPYPASRLWPSLETLSAVVSIAVLEELPDALHGLRQFCHKLKSVKIRIRGEANSGIEDWVTCVMLVHAEAGEPFELAIVAK